MNYIANMIIECFEDANFDQSYIESKKHAMSDENKYESLLRVASLDTRIADRLATKMNCDADELRQTVNFLWQKV